MKPLIIYHDNCADGFGAAFAAHLKLGDEAEYLPMQYGDFAITEEGLIGRDVYILDFSLPRDRMDKLFSIAKRVVWLDHHKTAFELYGLTPNRPDETALGVFGVLEVLISKHYVNLDNNKSGAMLAWEYFHPDKEVPMLIKHIDDYDRRQFKLEGTKEFNKALWSYAPWSFKQWDNFFPLGAPAIVNWRMEDMHKEGAAILRAHDANVAAIVKGAVRECSLTFNVKDMSGSWYDMEYTRKGLAANCPPHLASDVGHQLADQSGTYGLLWAINKEGKCLCSLRSNGDYDVSAIAKAFGGGGHKNAAGFEVPIETLLEWIK